MLTGADMNSQRVLNVADPSSATDAANKQYVDNYITGLSWKDEARVASTTNGTLASAYANGSSVDGVSLVTGDRILLKDQTTQTENGIYTVNASGAPTRAVDANTSAKLNNATVLVTAGTANVNKAYTQTTANPTLGSSNVVFVQFGGGGVYAAGNGLTGTTTFSVLNSNSTITVSGSGIEVALTFNGGLQVSSGLGLKLDTNPGLQLGAGGLSVKLNGSTLTLGASGLSVTTPSIGGAADCTAGTTTTITHSLGTKDLIVQIQGKGVNAGILVDADVAFTTTSAFTVTFPTSVSAGDYRIVYKG